MLQILDPDEHEIAAIQEPYLNHTHNSWASLKWYTLYPKEHYAKPNKTRSLLLINRRILTNNWAQIDFALSNVTAVQLQTPSGQVLLINMYNDGKNPEGAQKVIQYMRNIARAHNPRHSPHIIWMGDFNTHHPMWDKERNSHLFMRTNLDKVQIIIDVKANHDLQMLLPKNIPNLCAMETRNFTQLDNVLAYSSLQEHVLECKTSPETCTPRTDHIPIITTLDMNLGRQEEMLKPNFKSTNWPKFQKELTKKLKNIDTQHEIRNKSEFYRRLNALTLAITDMIESAVPKLRPSPYTK